MDRIGFCPLVLTVLKTARFGLSSTVKEESKDMQKFRYLSGVSTLLLDAETCIGCGMCEIVCPQGVFRVENRRAKICDLDGCMECGACTKNCPTDAIHVTPGVGCANYIIKTWIRGKNSASCCEDTECC
jgi:NAD-dependent dihydropyrimidine dehydrogenase PreA subunit